MNRVIVAKGITKKFDSAKVLNQITLEVEQGSFFGLFGPNGAGKTTLLRILTGQLPATSGEASVLGIEVEHRIEVKRRVGVVLEYEALPSFLTPHEYLHFVAKVRRIGKEGVKYWLDWFDLSSRENTLCKDLSKGMRQKLLLASAFLHEPRVLFLDEPFINLDPLYQRKVRTYLHTYVNSGGTIFLCSHILEIAEKLCDQIAIINQGELVAHFPITELRKRKESLENVFYRMVEHG